MRRGIRGAEQVLVAVRSLPDFVLFFSAAKRMLRSRHDWNISSTDEFEHAQSVGHVGLEPCVAGYDRDAEDIRLRRLDQQQHRLLVGSGGSGSVLIDDDLAFVLGPTREACHQYCCYNPYSAEFHFSPRSLKRFLAYSTVFTRNRHRVDYRTCRRAA